MNTLKRKKGFTLLEMIVALAISGLLVTLAYGSLRIGVKSWQASQTRVDEHDAMRIGWQFLHRSLSQAKSLSDPTKKQTVALFHGTSDNLSFVTDMPSYLGLGGLYVVNIGQTGEDKKQFKLSRVLFSEYKQVNLENTIQEAILVDDLNRINISYYGDKTNNKKPAWHSDWLEQKTLPQLIRIDLKKANGKSWPTLIAHIQLGRNRGVDIEDSEFATSLKAAEQ